MSSVIRGALHFLVQNTEQLRRALAGEAQDEVASEELRADVAGLEFS